MNYKDKKNCRNGHPKDIYGEMHETPARPLHLRCRKCRADQRKKQEAYEKVHPRASRRETWRRKKPTGA